MTPQELLAALTATVDRDGIDFDPSDSDAPYIDWSIQTENGRQFEIGAEGDSVVIELTWEEIERLQRALTVLVLERQ